MNSISSDDYLEFVLLSTVNKSSKPRETLTLIIYWARRVRRCWEYGLFQKEKKIILANDEILSRDKYKLVILILFWKNDNGKKEEMRNEAFSNMENRGSSIKWVGWMRKAQSSPFMDGNTNRPVDQQDNPIQGFIIFT